MKSELMHEICRLMAPHLNAEQNQKLEETFQLAFKNYHVPKASEQKAVLTTL